MLHILEVCTHRGGLQHLFTSDNHDYAINMIKYYCYHDVIFLSIVIGDVWVRIYKFVATGRYW